MGIKELMYNIERGRFTQDMWYRRFNDDGKDGGDIPAKRVEPALRRKGVAKGELSGGPGEEPVGQDVKKFDG